MFFLPLKLFSLSLCIESEDSTQNDSMYLIRFLRPLYKQMWSNTLIGSMHNHLKILNADSTPGSVSLGEFSAPTAITHKRKNKLRPTSPIMPAMAAIFYVFFSRQGHLERGRDRSLQRKSSIKDFGPGKKNALRPERKTQDASITKDVQSRSAQSRSRMPSTSGRCK